MTRSFFIKMAHLLMFSFCLQLTLPFYATYLASPLPNISSATDTTVPSSPYADFFSGKILICTGSSFKLVSWQELKKQKDVPPPSPYHCAFCYLNAHHFNHAQPVESFRLSLSLVSAQIKYVFSEKEQKTLTVNLGKKQTRAPPVFPFYFSFF